MTVALAPHISVADTERGMVLLDERSGRFWQLNGAGAVVLRLLLGGSTVDDTVTELRRRTPRGSEHADHDVAALVGTLRDAQLVTT